MKNLNFSQSSNSVSEVKPSPENRSSSKKKKTSTSRPQDINHHYKVDISLKSILLVGLAVGAVYIGMQLLQVALILFLAFVIASAAMPAIRFLQNKGLPKGLGALVVYLVGSLLVVAILILIILPFGKEISGIVQELPQFVETVSDNISETLGQFGIEVTPDDVSDVMMDFYQERIRGGFIFNISSGINNAWGVLSPLGTVLGSLLLSFIISIYIVYDHDSFLDLLLLRIVDKRKRDLVKTLVMDVEKKLGGWVLGQGTDSLIVALLTWILLTALQVPFALPLALLTGLLVMIPTFGPFLAAIPAIAIAVSSGGLLIAVIVAVGYVIIQQIENVFLVPKIMGGVVGVKPIVVLVGVLIGLALGGIVGAMITVPILVIIKIGYEFYISYQKLEAEENE